MPKRKNPPSPKDNLIQETPTKRNKQSLGQKLKSGLSIIDQAQPYLLTTAKFPLDALTSTWSNGSNRPIDLEHVKILCQVFEQQQLQRESPTNRLYIACSQIEIQRMIMHIGEQPSEAAEAGEVAGWKLFQDWMSVNKHPAEIIAG